MNADLIESQREGMVTEKLSSAERELVALGAALGSNCVPCIDTISLKRERLASAIGRSTRPYASPTRFGRFLPGRFSPLPLACFRNPMWEPMPSGAAPTAPNRNRTVELSNLAAARPYTARTPSPIECIAVESGLVRTQHDYDEDSDCVCASRS